MEARHFPDRSPSNNELTNLQWGTKKQNQADSIKHGTWAHGERCGRSKLTNKQVEEIKKGGNAPLIARRFKVSVRTVYDIRQGKTWRSQNVS
jgi:hypothetical protein